MRKTSAEIDKQTQREREKDR